MGRVDNKNVNTITAKIDDNTLMRCREVCEVLGVSFSKLIKCGILFVINALYNDDGTINKGKIDDVKDYIIGRRSLPKNKRAGNR